MHCLSGSAFLRYYFIDVTIMSHDTRTPMNAIIGITSLIRHDAGNKAKVIEYADKIDISSQHLLGIINDVLDMSKIEAGKTVFKFRSIKTGGGGPNRRSLNSDKWI